jgi:hypothetical protein
MPKKLFVVYLKLIFTWVSGLIYLLNLMTLVGARLTRQQPRPLFLAASTSLLEENLCMANPFLHVGLDH